MLVIVSPAQPSDAPALAQLAALTFPLACPPGTPAQDVAAFITQHLSIERFHEYLTSPHAKILVARSGQRLLGYSLILTGDSAQPAPEYGVHGNPTVYVSKFYIDPTFHGSGVAHRLMTGVLAATYDLGAQSAWLSVNKQNTRASAFYAKHGFTTVGGATQQVGEGVHCDVVMERPCIAPPAG